MKRSAVCCSSGVPEATPVNGYDRQADRLHDPVPPECGALQFEDQRGNSITYHDAFNGHPTIVAFFYTRCNNPNKCSLTITSLAALQRAIQSVGLQEELHIAAITYDPEYDLPSRLRAYGDNRGIVFDAHCHFMRTLDGFDTLRAYFELGVSYGQPLVNQHRIELFILDDTGSVVATFARLQWNVYDVLEQARAMLRAPSDRVSAP